MILSVGGWKEIRDFPTAVGDETIALELLANVPRDRADVRQDQIRILENFRVEPLKEKRLFFVESLGYKECSIDVSSPEFFNFQNRATG